MSLITQAYIVEKYGLRLTIEQLAEALGLAKNTIYNQIAAGTFGVKTYLDGKQRWTDYRDLAEYLDSVRERGGFQA